MLEVATYDSGRRKCFMIPPHTMPAVMKVAKWDDAPIKESGLSIFKMRLLDI